MYDKKSDALKLFLAEFRNGSSSKWLKDKDYYKTKIYSHYLGNLNQTLQNLIKDGLLRRMTPEEIIAEDYKITELKEECKKRGLKVSGKKADLVARLLEADSDLLKSYEKRDDLWICTALGVVMVEDFYKQQEQMEKDLRTLVFAFFDNKRFKDAANAVEQIRSRRIFPDWFTTSDKIEPEISLDHEEKEVEIIWNETPKVLRKIKSSFVDKARYWISYDILRGTNHIREFEKEPTDIEGVSIGQVMQALMIYASGKMQLSEWQKIRIFKGVRIEGLPSETVLCPECQKLTGKIYDFKKAPVIPNEKCRNASPCPLCYVADTEGPKKGLFGLFG